ncbi:glycerol-1-phosphate dehydrogenase [Limnochorda pilosa]|uniref:Glycerol-1-phosphate dehydrogenase n=1 Tax=Limnochorda pilosa TaxID=1555112 RepID=A0A0K2SLF5_LIMPI|nr:glycerol-1-phosphate dehydrogenase [Limnochorda pilosa]
MRQVTGWSDPSLASLVGREFSCPCGRTHALPIDTLATHSGSLQEVGAFLKRQGASGVWIIADQITYEAAGRAVEEACRASGLAVEPTILPGDPAPHADREALGRLAFDLQPGRIPLVAVGSGTVCDLARFMAYRTGTFFVAVPTAPSVDGFTSSVAAMLVDGVRITYPAAPPRAIFADPAVFARAPHTLIASGYAEMLGKLTALADWRLATTLNGEYHCPVAEELVLEAVRPILSDPSSTSALMEALLWVGLAMLLVGNSRPASGAEHHLAHYWEMRALWEGRDPLLHGLRVGVASVLVQRVYGEILQRRREIVPRLAGHGSRRSPHGTEADIRAWYGPVAERLLEEHASWSGSSYGPRPLTAPGLAAAGDAVGPYLLPLEAATAFLRKVGAPALPHEIGVDPDLVRTSLRAAKEVRHRFTILHLASELGLLDEVSEALAQEAGREVSA